MNNTEKLKGIGGWLGLYIFFGFMSVLSLPVVIFVPTAVIIPNAIRNWEVFGIAHIPNRLFYPIRFKRYNWKPKDRNP